MGGFCRRVIFRRLGDDRLRGVRGKQPPSLPALRPEWRGVTILGPWRCSAIGSSDHVGVDRDVHCAGGEVCVEKQYVQLAGDEAVRLKQRFAVRSTVASECETYLVPLRLRIAKLLPAGS